MRAAFRPRAEGIESDLASQRLADLGFLSGPDLPDRPGPAYLLVALRDAPTLRHYDPERVEYWVSRGGRGTRESLTRTTRLPLDLPFSWGMIRLYDRLSVTNEYLAFGGRLSAAEIDGATIAVFTSPVPMLRRGGHSQAWDEGTDALGGFFGKLVAAVDVHPEVERRLAAADPLARYSAFVRDLVRRYRGSVDLRGMHPHVWTMLSGEEVLMRRDHPDAWAAGGRLLEELAG